MNNHMSLIFLENVRNKLERVQNTPRRNALMNLGETQLGKARWRIVLAIKDKLKENQEKNNC